MKVALVHDYLVERGGAEKVLAALSDAYPDAPIFTSVYNPETTLDMFRGRDVRTSFLQKLTSDPRRYRVLLPLYPLAFRLLDLRGFDLVISSASAFAKGLRAPADTYHICYCHTPPRFVWGYQAANETERVPAAARLMLRLLCPYLRAADRRGAEHVDRFVANSRCVADRIASLYGREAAVVPPPIDCSQFEQQAEPGEFFLIVSRLVPYKRIDVAIEAFSRNGLPLLIAGDGRDRERLAQLARGANVRFLGYQPQERVRELLAGCRALVVTAEEDFGMAALEANASGRPVIAYGAGGALETVVPGRTGLMFGEQTAESLLAALDEFALCSFDQQALVRHARQFDTREFQRRIRDIVSQEMGTEQAPSSAQPALQPERARS